MNEREEELVEWHAAEVEVEDKKKKMKNLFHECDRVVNFVFPSSATSLLSVIPFSISYVYTAVNRPQI